MEIASGNVPALLQYLLADSSGGGGSFRVPSDAEYHGRWAGDRIVVAGDYSESAIGLEEDDEYATLYDKAQAEYTDISEEAKVEYNAATDVHNMRIHERPWEKGERFDVVGIHPDRPSTLAREVEWQDAMEAAREYEYGSRHVVITSTEVAEAEAEA